MTCGRHRVPGPAPSIELTFAGGSAPAPSIELTFAGGSAPAPSIELTFAGGSAPRTSAGDVATSPDPSAKDVIKTRLESCHAFAGLKTATYDHRKSGRAEACSPGIST